MWVGSKFQRKFLSTTKYHPEKLSYKTHIVQKYKKKSILGSEVEFSLAFLVSGECHVCKRSYIYNSHFHLMLSHSQKNTYACIYLWIHRCIWARGKVTGLGCSQHNTIKISWNWNITRFQLSIFFFSTYRHPIMARKISCVLYNFCYFSF